MDRSPFERGRTLREAFLRRSQQRLEDFGRGLEQGGREPSLETGLVVTEVGRLSSGLASTAWWR